MLERGHERNVKPNLIFGIDARDGFQDGFEGSKYFGWSLRKFDRKCGTAKSPVDPSSLLS